MTEVDLLEPKSELDKLILAGFPRLLRGEQASLAAFIREIKVDVPIGGTNCVCHFYFIDLDGNGRPRVKDLAAEIVLYVMEYAIPRSAIEKAYKYRNEHKSSREVLRLQKEAKSLFVNMETSGEGGEFLLFLFAESYLKLPQILCKMALKTNTNVHFHGADGVYAGIDENTGGLAIYWGESKLHSRANKAISECFKSLAPFLLDDGGTGSVASRDLQLLNSQLDLASPHLETALKAYLDKSDPLFKKLQFRGIALAGFDQNEYPEEPNQINSEELKGKLEKEHKKWLKKIKSEQENNKIASFHIHVFCVPFPSVQKFRSYILEELGK